MVIKAGPTPASLAELQAVVLAFKVMDRELRSDVNKATRETLNPMWRGLLAANAATPMQQQLLAKGARVAAGNPPRLLAATSKRPIKRGSTLTADRYGRAWEFGSKSQGDYSTYTRRSRNGRSHQVRRRTRAQLPSYVASGRVVFPAVAEAMPRMVSLWTQIAMRKSYEAFESR